ncbi:type IV pilus modification PilV family protein [Caldisericum exile]|uniref:Prepilin-type N-terminal cleavage/methylation domain-containing protein n=1 Tax=Caldisericum exile (strain DSM 21853 / NBRC 104410 / AZM16c01) TaxID=511051 RepID=A0A7U6GFG9_CALEA|nr:prepilin-type N-terminal cleavage/methylation domain-containing protein [Caldisericum exile]BAL81443.1 hypothetical protein CSE_13170 [Caldisericum exile AZM16c01]
MKRKGFTLIELAVSIALISIVVLWSINIFTNLGKNESTSSDLEIATTLASLKVEEIKGYSYSELSSLSTPQTGTFPPPYDAFSYRIDFTSSSSSSNYYIRRATISIFKGNSTTPLIKMDANFLRKISDGANIGL